MFQRMKKSSEDVVAMAREVIFVEPQPIYPASVIVGIFLDAYLTASQSSDRNCNFCHSFEDPTLSGDRGGRVKIRPQPVDRGGYTTTDLGLVPVCVSRLKLQIEVVE